METSTIVNKEVNAIIKTNWDKFAQLYDEMPSTYNYPSYVTLLVHAKVNEKFNILDVACGTGAH